MKHDIDQLRAQRIKLEKEAPLKIKTRKQLDNYNAELEQLNADIQLARFAQLQEARQREEEALAQAEREEQRHKGVLDKLRERLISEVLEPLQQANDKITDIWKSSEDLFRELAEVDFNVEPAFMSNFRREYHTQHFCRVFYSRGMGEIVDEWKRYQPTATPRELNMTDFLDGYTYRGSAYQTPMEVEIVTGEADNVEPQKNS
tara:strand:+ start:68 stop:676 length:609 start_codon:yes stop_codon:yes gene_type:complete